jgi:hypothetical protein
MGIQLKAECRNARLDAIETYGSTSCALRIYTGAQPADCITANSGTLLVDINLPADWMQAAAAGSKAKGAGAWSAAASGGAAATPGHFRIYNSQATKDQTTCFIQGSCAIGSGDINFDGTITSGQTVTISAFTLTDANS